MNILPVIEDTLSIPGSMPCFVSSLYKVGIWSILIGIYVMQSTIKIEDVRVVLPWEGTGA